LDAVSDSLILFSIKVSIGKLFFVKYKFCELKQLSSKKIKIKRDSNSNGE